MMSAHLFFLLTSVIWLPALITIIFDVLFGLTSLETHRWFFYLVMPGVVIHELSHALGCVIMRQPIVDFHPFKLPDKDGTLGYVEHMFNPFSMKDQLIGNGVISLMPSYVISTILIGLYYFGTHGHTGLLVLLAIVAIPLVYGLRLSAADWLAAKYSIVFWIVLSAIIAHFADVFTY